MFVFLQKMSLGMRLLVLTAFALIALLIALLSAYRTAQMSAIFTERQAETSVKTSLREILRESSNIGQRPDPNRKIPPHIKEINQRYSDDFSRSTAIALHRFEDVSGGFCSENGETKGAIFNQTFSTDEMQYIKNACQQIANNQSFETKKLEFTDSILFMAAEQTEEPNSEIKGAFTARSVAKTNFFAERFNLLTQGFLLLAVIGLVVFSLLTLREWRRGMLKIENGLGEISQDLKARIDLPKLTELNQIGFSINGLAENLEKNLQRQKELETDLTRNEKLAALGRVASGIAHEVRNPLASMKLKIQLAERANFAPEKLEKTFTVLRGEIERLDNLVKKLLDISRPTKLKTTELSLVSLIEQRLSFIKEKADAQNIFIKTEFADQDSIIKADGEKLAQVFDNLFLNALEAMPNGGNLQVSIVELTDYFQIKITDNGEGVAAESREKLFEPFFTTKEKGTGLGLAVSREIIEMHGGRIYLAETIRTEFIIEIPKVKNN